MRTRGSYIEDAVIYILGFIWGLVFAAIYVVNDDRGWNLGFIVVLSIINLCMAGRSLRKFVDFPRR